MGDTGRGTVILAKESIDLTTVGLLPWAVELRQSVQVSTLSTYGAGT